MPGFTYTLELLEPLLANSLAGDANSALSLLYVPGSLVRGAAISVYCETHSVDAGDETTEVRRLFFDGRTRFLHAYPVITESERRSLPAPLAWHNRKRLQEGESKRARMNFDLSVKPELREQHELKGLGEARFCWLKPDDEKADRIAYWVATGEQLNVHTQRDAVLGRADEVRGAVFRYEALPAGLKLKGVVLTKDKEDADTLGNLLKRTLRLGKSRSAGYGAVKVTVSEPFADGDEVEHELGRFLFEERRERKAEAERMREAQSDGDRPEYADAYEREMVEEEIEPQSPEETNTFRKFTLTLLSDTIVRDENGQHTLNPLPALARKLGREYGLELDNTRSFCKAEMVGGFNRKWGLPLPQVVAIAAGSLFTIKVTGDAPLPLSLLEQLQQEGLGERRLDGYGRVVAGWYYNPPKLWSKEDERDRQRAQVKSGQEPIPLTDEERRLAELMLSRLLRRDLDRMLQVRAGELRVKGNVSNSQLSRLRGLIFSVMGEASPVRRVGRMTEFLTREEEKSSAAWESLRRARVSTEGNPRLNEWIRRVLTEENSPWKELAKDPTQLKRSLGDITVEPDYAMAVEYRLRLIDAVLERKAKPSGE